MNGPRAVRTLMLVVAAACALASCAPRPPRGLETLEQAARRGAEARERRWASCEAVGALRLDGRATGRTPALMMGLRAAAPDRVRVRVQWALGVLGEVAVRGDTLVAWLPTQRLGVRFGGLADSLGVHDPAAFLVRSLAAAWVAPREAWRDAVADSAGVSLAWREGDGDAWTMRVDLRGRPVEARVQRADHVIMLRISEWRGAGDDAHPTRLEIADGDGWVRLRLDLDDLVPRPRPRAQDFALELPAGVRPLEWSDLRALFALGGLSR
ncbi:MAG: hypothetical protein RL721_870 [Candidatus Eisenbacteria bacterium]|jgi:hypothetical protein